MIDDIFKRVTDALTGGNGSEGSEESPRPASEDPYGDPANDPSGNYEEQNVRSASEDPYGDPANNPGGNYEEQNVRSASEDPYGDPADDPQNFG